MLVIRKEQKEVMEAAAAVSFESELAGHIKGLSPRHAAAVGDDAIKEAVRSSIERSKVYGFTKRGPVRFFAELTLMFGSEFDTDLLLPWANGVLTNPSIKDEMERADILHEAMLAYLEQVGGKDKQFIFDSMRRFSKATLDDYHTPGSTFDDAMIAMLKVSYPQRCQYLGDEAINELLEMGKNEARARQITSAKGAALLIVLMFQLGHGAIRDPLFPWVAATLDDESVTDPNERVKNLRAKSVKYLEQTLKNLGQERSNGAS